MEDREKRIDEILHRVMDRLEQGGAVVSAAPATSAGLPTASAAPAMGQGPFYLLLAHGPSDALTACRQALVKAGDEAAVYLADALSADPDAVRRASAVIIFDLSISDLASAALAHGGSRYAIWIREAILRGKPVLAAREGVELFRYAQTAPAPYYSRLLGHLRHLIRSGLRLIPLEKGKAGLRAALAGTAPGLTTAEQLALIAGCGAEQTDLPSGCSPSADARPASPAGNPTGRLEATAQTDGAEPSGARGQSGTCGRSADAADRNDATGRSGAAHTPAARIWDRRVLSERDLKQLDWGEIRVIRASRPVILTDLAREFLERHQIKLEIQA